MNWQQIKAKTDRLPIPDLKQATMSAVLTLEGKDKEGHILSLYKFPVYSELGFDIELRWAFCPECRFLVWQKFVAWNNEENLCYERKVL
jgi:hypothetical protein